MDKLLDLLSDIRPDLDFSKEERLIEGGVLDSFDIITVVSEINDAFNVSINVADLIPDNLNSAPAMWDLISRFKNQEAGD